MLQVEDEVIEVLAAGLGPGVYSPSNRNEYQKQKRYFWESERGHL
jgi:hypothetical protein